MTAFCVTETKSVLYAAEAENFKNVKDKSVKEWNSMKDRYMEFRRARREEAEERQEVLSFCSAQLCGRLSSEHQQDLRLADQPFVADKR